MRDGSGAELAEVPEGAGRPENRRFSGRTAMAALYVVAGTLHFVITESYMPLMPRYLPAHRGLVLLSGAAEIAGGLGLLAPQSRRGQPGRAAAWGLVLLLVAVFPANVTMVAEHFRFPRVPLWAAWLRLPLQVPLLWWAWRYTRLEGGRSVLVGTGRAETRGS